MIITIDGAAGTGKSTVAKQVAYRLHLAYFDTGAMYRAFAYFIIKASIDPHAQELIIPLVKEFNFCFEGVGIDKTYFVNGEDVTPFLRTPHVSEVSSVISQYPQVRAALHQIQKTFAQNHSAVFEGRDLGTVIFPDADYKFFLTASAEVRAQRRFIEMSHKGHQISFDEVLASICQRDLRDQTRPVAPLKCAQDAHVIDTSLLCIDEVVDQILEIVGSV